MALLLLPTADAELRFENALLSGSPVQPLTGIASFTVDVSVDCEHVPPLGGATLQVEGTSTSDQIQVAGPPSQAIPSSDCIGVEAILVPVAFGFQATALAPGEVPLPIDVAARLNTTSAFPAEPVALRFDLEVAPLVRCAIRMEQAIQSAEPGGMSDFTIHVMNHGNTRSTFTMRLVQPLTAEGVMLPATVLDSAAQGGPAVSADLVASFPAPARSGAELAYQVEVSSASVQDPTVEATCGTFSVLVVTEPGGVAGSGIPGPGILAGLAIVVAGLAARRRP